MFKIAQNKWMVGLIHKDLDGRQSSKERRNLSDMEVCVYDGIPIGIVICDLNLSFISCV